jgi:hypothetical protein
MDSAEPTIAFGNHMPSRIAGELVSIAGLRGRFVFDRTGRHVGRLADLVVRLDTEDAHPPIHGALIRAGTKLHYIPEAAIVGIRDWNLYLCTVGLAPRTIPANDHLVRLAHHVPRSPPPVAPSRRTRTPTNSARSTSVEPGTTDHWRSCDDVEPRI